MQDVERNVPIDTSGNEVDVDIEETKDEAVIEQVEENTEKETDKSYENERETKLEEGGEVIKEEGKKANCI